MSTHRIGLLLTLVATSALAAKPVPPPSLSAVGNWYADVGMGHALHQWRDEIGAFSGTYTWDRGDGGFTGGFDIGYHISRPFSVEAGYYVLPKATITLDGTDYKVRASMPYVAFRGDWSVLPALSVFGEVGAAYNIATVNRPLVVDGLGHEARQHWGPLFGLGGSYAVTNHVTLGLKYLFADGENTNINDVSAPTKINPKTQLILATLGVDFAGLNHPATNKYAPKTDKPYSMHVGLGYVSHQWRDDMGSFDQGETWTKGDGGLAMGGDVGYRFARYFGVEAGFYAMPKAMITIDGSRYNFKSNLTYLALRGDFALTKAFDLFAEAGAGYQHAKGDKFVNVAASYEEKSHIGPLLGIGGEYTVGNDLSLGVKYLYADGEATNDNQSTGLTRIVPKAQLILATVGYRL